MGVLALPAPEFALTIRFTGVNGRMGLPGGPAEVLRRFTIFGVLMAPKFEVQVFI